MISKEEVKTYQVTVTCDGCNRNITKGSFYHIYFGQYNTNTQQIDENTTFIDSAHQFCKLSCMNKYYNG